MLPLLWSILGLSLLYIPLWQLRHSHARLAGYDQRTWPLGRHIWISFFDFGRALFGTHFAVKGVLSLAADWQMRWWTSEGSLAVLLSVGLACQLVAWYDDDHIQAPVFWVAGCLIALLHPVVVIPAILLGIGTAVACRAWSGGFLAGAATIGALAFIFPQQRWSIGVIGGVICASPALLAMMFGRQLGWLRKRADAPDRLR